MQAEATLPDARPCSLGARPCRWLCPAAPYVPTDDAQVLERLPSRSTPQFRELQVAAGRSGEIAARSACRPRARAPRTFARRASKAIRAFWAMRRPRSRRGGQDPAAPDRGAGAARDDPAKPARVRRGGGRSRPRPATRAAACAGTADPRHRPDGAGQVCRSARDCERLAAVVPPIYPAICRAAIDSVTGQRRARLRRSAACAGDRAARVDATQRVWGQTLLGEIAHRRGDRAAERSFPCGARRRRHATSTCSARTATGCSTRARRRRDRAARQTRRASIRCCCASRLRRTRCRRARSRGVDRDVAGALRREPRARRHGASARERALRALRCAPIRAARSRSRSTTGTCSASPRTCASSPKPRPPRTMPRRSTWSGVARRDGLRLSGRGRTRSNRGQAVPRMKRLARSWSRRSLLGRAASAPAQAHKPSDSYLSLDVDGKHDRRPMGHRAARSRFCARARRQSGRRDHLGRGQGEARRHRRLRAVAACAWGRRARPARLARQGAADRRSQRRRVCGAALHRHLRRRAQVLAIDYRLFFDLDPQHRGLLRLEYQGATRAGIFAADKPEQSFTLARIVEVGTVPRLRQRRRLAHLDRLRPRPVPAVAAAAGGARCARTIPGRRWQPAASFRAAFIDVVKVVTAFTRRAFDHAVARGARRRERCPRAGSSRRSRCRSCLPRSTTSGRWCTASAG